MRRGLVHFVSTTKEVEKIKTKIEKQKEIIEKFEKILLSGKVDYHMLEQLERDIEKVNQETN